MSNHDAGSKNKPDGFSPEMKVYSAEMRQEVEHFFKECFDFLGWEYEPEKRHYDLTHIQDVYMVNGCFWCLFDGEKLIGTVAVHEIEKDRKIAEMKRLYVLPEYQGRGLGECLFIAALDYARTNDYCRLRADTRHDRMGSLHLLNKYGFTAINQYNENSFAQEFYELQIR